MWGEKYQNCIPDFSPHILRPVDPQDSELHATLLHLMGFDHEQHTYRHAELDFQLSGVEPANVVQEMLA